MNKYFTDRIRRIERENEILWRELRGKHYDENVFHLGDEVEQMAWDQYREELEAEIAHNGE